MKFIQKKYYDVEEIYTFSGLTTHDLEYFIHEEIIFLAVLIVFPITIIKSVSHLNSPTDFAERANKSNITPPSIDEEYTGLINIKPNTATALLNGRSTRLVSGFDNQNNRILVVKPGDGELVYPKDLKITADQLEILLSLASPSNIDFSHSNDYSRIKHNGIDYKLGPVQAAVIIIMHKASDQGDGWCNGRAMLSEITCDSKRMQDVFKQKANRDWKPLFERDFRGNIRIRRPK